MGDESRMQKGTPSIVVSIILDDGEEVRVELGDSPIIIGSSEDSDVMISSSFVSHKHAMLYVKDRSVYIEDLNSSNGVEVDGDFIRDRCLLSGGELIKLGEWKATFLLGFNDAMDSLSPFSVGKTPDESGGGEHKITPTFDWIRLIPMLAYCLLFAWWIPTLRQKSHMIDYTWAPVLILALSSFFLAILTSVYFFRPYRFLVRYTLGVLLFTMILSIGLNYILDSGSPNTIAVHVGMVVKLLPVFYLVFSNKESNQPNYREFLLTGFFSGFGFGIGETLVSYSPLSAAPQIVYASLVGRWFTSVPLHGIYNVIAAALMWGLIFNKRRSDNFMWRIIACGGTSLVVAAIYRLYSDMLGGNLRHILANGLSIILMCFVVMLVAKWASEPDAVLLDVESKGIIKWIAGFETGKRSLLPYFIYIACLTFGASAFSVDGGELDTSLPFIQLESILKRMLR